MMSHANLSYLRALYPQLFDRGPFFRSYRRNLRVTKTCLRCGSHYVFYYDGPKSQHHCMSPCSIWRQDNGALRIPLRDLQPIRIEPVWREDWPLLEPRDDVLKGVANLRAFAAYDKRANERLKRTMQADKRREAIHVAHAQKRRAQLAPAIPGRQQIPESS